MQFYMEEFVEKSKDVHLQARKAYTSFIRSYSTYSNELKSIFYVKNLHLGHMAKCFGLREAPKEIAREGEPKSSSSSSRHSSGTMMNGKRSNNSSFNQKRKDKESTRRPQIVRNEKNSNSTNGDGAETKQNENSHLDLSGLLRNYKAVSEYSSGLETSRKAAKKRPFSSAFDDDNSTTNSNNRNCKIVASHRQPFRISAIPEKNSHRNHQQAVLKKLLKRIWIFLINITTTTTTKFKRKINKKFQNNSEIIFFFFFVFFFYNNTGIILNFLF